MKNIDFGKACKNVCNFVVTTFTFGLTYMFMFSSPRNESRVTDDYIAAGYSTAAKAIVESDMLDHYKRDTMKILKRCGDSEYYKAVISIVNSDMADHYIRDIIGSLS